jgi:hypothetical protein
MRIWEALQGKLIELIAQERKIAGKEREREREQGAFWRGTRVSCFLRSVKKRRFHAVLVLRDLLGLKSNSFVDMVWQPISWDAFFAIIAALYIAFLQCLLATLTAQTLADCSTRFFARICNLNSVVSLKWAFDLCVDYLHLSSHNEAQRWASEDDQPSAIQAIRGREAGNKKPTFTIRQQLLWRWHVAKISNRWERKRRNRAFSPEPRDAERETLPN